MIVIVMSYNMVNAQISVRNKSKENHYPKETIVYDSLNNFGYDIFGVLSEPYSVIGKQFNSKEEGVNELKRIFSQYIGQRILILPNSEKANSKWANDKYSNLRGKYFTIVSIDFEFEDSYFNSTKKLENKVYVIQDDNGSRTKWIVPSYSSEEAILLGFYEKLKTMFVYSAFIYNVKATGGGSQFLTPKLTHRAIDAQTDDIIPLNVGDRWTCSDFQIVDDDVTVQLYAVLNNNNGNEILARLGNRFKTKGELNITFFSCFVKESEFEAKRKMLTEKYGEENANLICHQQVVIGMTKEMCRESWDTPESVNKTVIDGLVTEQWIYSNGSYLYFKDDVLTAIQQ